MYGDKSIFKLHLEQNFIKPFFPVLHVHIHIKDVVSIAKLAPEKISIIQ
jgi:hypothetical protein